MTLTEIRTAIRAVTLVPTAQISDANLLTFINEGLYRIAAASREWPWLEDIDEFTTTAAQQNYDLLTDIATDLDRISSVYSNTKRTALQQVSHQDALTQYGGDMPTGTHADAFYVWDGDLFLLPVPDTSAIKYKVYYYKTPTALSAAGDSPAFDVVFHRALTHYGEMRCWQFEEDFQKAQAAELMFFRVLDDMLKFYRDRVDDSPWAVGVPARSLTTRTNTPFLDGL